MSESSWLEAVRSIDFTWWLLTGGIFALVFTVLVLARLRGIQSKPLRVCIVLSVLAHLLFLVSAHLMNWFDTPRFAGDNTIHFELTFDDATVDQTVTEPVEEDLEPPPVEDLVETEPLELVEPSDPNPIVSPSQRRSQR